jgi:hypothetical protein
MRAVLGKLNDELLLNLAMKAAPYCSHVDAAIAYADGRDHRLVQICKEKGLSLSFTGLLDETGAVSPGLLKELLTWGPTRANARLVKGHFHAKVIWWRGYGAYVGSANLTHKAWFNNIEAGVFLDEKELASSGVGDELDAMFDHLERVSVAVSDETVAKLEQLGRDRQRIIDGHATRLDAKFKELFGHLPDNAGLTVAPPKGHRENRRHTHFVTEWNETLQRMRGLAREFAGLRLRPRWVDADAHPAVHFDQFLHAYYYSYVREEAGEDDDEGLSSKQKVEQFFTKNRADTARALREGARWWASLPDDPYDEAEFIRTTAPSMRALLSREAIARMDLEAFREAMTNVNAFRMHARQMKNADLGLPPGHHEDIEARVKHLCGWLWEQRSASGKTVRDVLEFVLWGASPSEMERRLWLGVWGDEYRLPHFGQSTLGEAVGWARPDDFPPRNNRTNKALRALGHNVKLFSQA